MHVQTSAGTLAVALLSGTVDNALGGATRMGGQAVDARRAYPRFSPTALYSLDNLEADYDDKEVGRGAGSEADDGKRPDTSEPPVRLSPDGRPPC